MTAVTQAALVAALLTWPVHAPLLEPSDQVAELVAEAKAGHQFGRIVPIALGPATFGTATHYGSAYNGRPLGCGGTYRSEDSSIVAVSPARYAAWPCGTRLQITGPAGTITVIRQDACPGCSANMVDLSEAGSTAVCGGTPHTCPVQIREVNR